MGWSWLRSSILEWIDQALAAGMGEDVRDPRWTGGLAVGSYDFVESVQLELGYGAMKRSIVECDGSCVLREDETCYDAILP